MIFICALVLIKDLNYYNIYQVIKNFDAAPNIISLSNNIKKSSFVMYALIYT